MKPSERQKVETAGNLLEVQDRRRFTLVECPVTLRDPRCNAAAGLSVAPCHHVKAI